MHTPDWQTAPDGQACPHAPQFVTLVVRLTSQPSGARALQSPKFAAHVRTVHEPVAQPADDVLGRTHTWPQAPQLEVLLLVSTQAPAQLVSPAPQKRSHTPEMHTAPVEQTFAQVPQLAGSIAVFAQYWVAPVPQVVSGVAQVAVHDPDEHTCPAPHAWLQAPQLALSVWVLAQAPAQLVKPKAHETMQCPAEQVVPDAHTMLHAPQLSGSVNVLVHAPPHAVCPATQVTRQVPETQVSPEGQTLPHAPQLLPSVCVFTSQPSSGLVLQSAKPMEHALMAHALATHDDVALGRLQARPQAPQL